MFYDQIKYNDFDTDIPSIFQNYSHCFLDPQDAVKQLNFSNKAYRTIDGFGNNIKKPQMGSSFTSFGRFIKASYDDNIHSLRKSIRGYNLPSPRNIVRKLFLNDQKNLNKFEERKKVPNHAAIMFGQFIAHDISSKQSVQYIDGGNRKFKTTNKFVNVGQCIS